MFIAEIIRSKIERISFFMIAMMRRLILLKKRNMLTGVIRVIRRVLSNIN